MSLSLLVKPRADQSGAPLVPEPDPPAWWIVGLALALALLLQTETAPWLGVRGASPSFVLLLVLWYGLRTGPAAGLLAGALAGVCEDALAGTTGGAWTVATAMIGALAGRSAGTFVTESAVWLVTYAAAATLLRYALFALVLGAESRSLPQATAHLHLAVWQAALDAVVAYVALVLFPSVRVSRVGFR